MSTFPATFRVNYTADLIDITPPAINRYGTTMTSQIASLTPNTTTVTTDYIDGTDVSAKHSVFAFDIVAGSVTEGTIALTDTYTSPSGTRTLNGGMPFYTPGSPAAIISIDYSLLSNNSFPVGYSEITFQITGLGTIISGGVSNGSINTGTRMVTIHAEALCLHGDSVVHTTKGFIKIKDILSSDDVYLIDSHDHPVKLVHNVKLLDSTKFILIEKDAIGPNQPSEPMHIIDGHPVLINNQEILPIKLINGSTIRYVELEATPIYTLVTEHRIFAKVNNMNVCTWSAEDINKRLFGIIHSKQ
jgi:hypothetical protein